MATPRRPSSHLDLSGSETHVGELLTERRGELNLSRASMARRAGVAYRMLQDIEHGHRQRYSTVNIGKIEDAYRWARGSIAAIAGGGAPTSTPDTEVVAQQPIDDPGRFGEEVRTIKSEVGDLVVYLVHDLESSADGMTDDEAEEMRRRVLDRLRQQAEVALAEERTLRDDRRRRQDDE